MDPAASFRIGDREVGGDAPLLFIAEAGVGHFGDLELALELVDLAADAGADAFKTQLFDVEALIAARADDWRQRLRPRNLPLEEFRQLRQRCGERGLLFIATAHDASRLPWLEELDVDAVKVGSGERNNPDFLTALAGLGKPMIVSTGMHSDADVRQAVEACRAGGCRELALLHCVTSYPTPDTDMNLRAMAALAKITPVPIGWSDHTEDHLACHAATALGAKLVEKHITIRRDIPDAQDWKVSAGPEDLAQLIEDLRRIERMLGHAHKDPAPSEEAAVVWATKSLVAAADLPAGHLLGRADIVAKRPGDGVPPDRIGSVLGKRLKLPLAADDPIDPEHLG